MLFMLSIRVDFFILFYCCCCCCCCCVAYNTTLMVVVVAMLGRGSERTGSGTQTHSLLFHKLLIGRLPSSLLFLHFFLSLEPLQQLPAAADANKSLLYSMSLKQQDEKKVTSIQFLSSSSSSFWVNKRQLKGTTHHKLHQQLRVQRYWFNET